ncbi:hypothetical protein ACOKM5_20665 [Streptomyces sp. BH097]|uniref:hypothetical protein n=1 Tax=Streptomyces sp. BH097 TaxID=3410406 RepID=UPI003CEF2B32
MIIEYTPQGGQTEILDAGRMRASEVQIIERTADMKWVAVLSGMEDGDITAIRVVGWVVKKRNNPSMRLAEFDPFDDEVRVRLDAKEVPQYAAQLVARFGDEPEKLADAFDELRDAAFDREACELAIKEATAPKAPAPSPEQEPTTASGSPTDG